MVIAVVGSGGKTTLIKKMAKEYLTQNKSVLITTSTHMFREEATLVTLDAKEIIAELKQKKYCFAGRALEDVTVSEKKEKPLDSRVWIGEKITALSPEVYEEACSCADVILIEADGSRNLPLKFPGVQEPVIYDNVEEIVIVFGLQGIGKKIKDVVHRWELAKEYFKERQGCVNTHQVVGIENKVGQSMWEGDSIVTLEHVQLLVQKGYIEPLKKQYPDKKFRLYGTHENPLYARVATACIKENMISTIKEEWFRPQPKLIILGGGHVSVALSKMALELDFQIKVMDDREEFANRERFPLVQEVICDSFSKVEAYLEPDAYYVVVTRGHKDDLICVEKILSTKYAYLGMIGSKLKVSKTLENLKNMGFLQEQLDSIFAPIGLPIHANTPAEIAISILAQIIQEKNKKQVSSVSKELLETKESGVLCIIIEKTGSSPRGVGSMMLVTKDCVIDSIGGGAVEFAAIEDARNCKEIMIKEYHLNNKDSERLGMICGGSNKVLFVPI